MKHRNAKVLGHPKMGKRNPGNASLKLSARDEQALRYGRGGQADDTRWLPEAAAGAMQAAGTDRLFRIALGAVAKALGRAAPVFRSSPAGQGGVHVPRSAATEADREALALYDRLLDGRKFAKLPRDAQLDIMRRTGWQELPTGETVKQLPRFEFGPGWTRYEPHATETRAVLSGVAENGVESIPPMTMSEAFAGRGADEFFGYYPNARRWLVRAGAAPAERVMGFSEPGSTAVTVTDEGLMRGAEPVLNTAHHETQHVIQNMSGMSPGSTSADALAELKTGIGNALLDGRGSDPAVVHALDTLQWAMRTSDPAYYAYQHAGGEAGAFAAGNAAVEGRTGELVTDAMSREGIAPENVYDLRALRQDSKGGKSKVPFDPAKDRLRVPKGKEKEFEAYMDSIAALYNPAVIDGATGKPAVMVDGKTYKGEDPFRPVSVLVPPDWREKTILGGGPGVGPLRDEPFDSDYDYVAAFLAGAKPGVNPEDGAWHMSDVGKMPNHESFSVESYYARDPRWAPYAGRWDGETYIPPEPQDVRQDTGGGKARGKYPGIANNPGNVEKHERRTDKALFKGEIGGGKRPKRFANFATPVDGLNAAALTIMRRAADLTKDGKDFTIANYAPLYNPPTENDTAAYVRNLSKYSGIRADEVLDPYDTDQMSRLLRNVVRFESGTPHSQWFTDDEYAAAAELMKEGAFD